jgi:alpha-beta hydrolase superfamily lysophospholipase
VGRLTQPATRAKAAVLLLPGSLYCDVDGNFPAWNVSPHAYRDLALQLAARGIAVLRQAKIGPGTGSETLDPETAKAHRYFETRVEVASIALDHLRNALPQTKCFVAGHSEGALVASLLAPKRADAIAGVVSLSGPALRLLDLMRGQTASMTPGADMSGLDACIAAIRAGQPLPEAAKSNPQTQMLASMPPEAHIYLRSVDAVDPLAAIAAVRAPVLIVQGGRDASVMSEQADQLSAARNGLPTANVRFPELQHFYKQAAPGMSPMEAFALSGEGDPAVADAIAGWMAQS